MITSGAKEDKLAMAYVQQVIESWRADGAPCAKLAVAERKDLQFSEQHVLDLVYEEYCLRHDRGENPEASTYCEQFPTLRDSIKDMLDVHETMQSDEDIASAFVPPTVRWPAEGDEYRGYRIQRRLGSGAMAQVYLASHEDLGARHVALKVSRDMKEAATAGRLDHPNVMDVHWVEQDDARNATWMCMPYCGSATLRDAINKAFSEEQAPEKAFVFLDYARRTGSAYATEVREPDESFVDGSYIEGCLHIGAAIADALRHAHERGILHRDLKPSNVLLTVSGVPKLLDFNLSSDPNVDVHRSGGTLGYMAPEHINSVFGFATGDAHVDSRSEVFALGVILFELMTGQLPFGRPDMQEGPWSAAADMLKTQAEDEIPRPSQLNPDISPDVEAMLLRCLERDPCRRFETAAELHAELKTLRENCRREATIQEKKARQNVATCGGVLLGIILFGLVQAQQDATAWSTADGRAAMLRGVRGGDSDLVENAFDSIAPQQRKRQDQELLAFSKFQGGGPKAAMAYYQRLDQLYPNDVAVLNNLAYCVSFSDAAHGQVLLRRGLSIEPDRPELLRNMVRLYTGEAIKQVSKLDRSVYNELSNRNLDSETRKRHLAGIVDLDDALEFVDRAVDVGGGHDQMFYGGAHFAHWTGQYDRAFDYALRAVEHGYPAQPLANGIIRFTDAEKARLLKTKAKVRTEHHSTEVLIPPRSLRRDGPRS